MNKNLKKTLYFLALMIIAMVCFAFSASATMVNSDYEYEYINNNSEVSIVKYLGTNNTVYTPNKIDGKPVTVIKESAFANNKNITYLWVGQNVKTICYAAFENCSALKEVILPDSLTSLTNYYSNGYGAFENCTALEKLTIGNGLTTISDDCFRNCTSLKTVNFGNSLKNISTNAFNNCTSLTTITLPDSMVTISGSAFANCATLKTVNCGKGLINICNGAFENCKKLAKINFSPVLNKIEYAAFENCSSLKEVILPDSLTTFTNYYSNGYGAFENCTALEKLTIGNGLSTISDDCFRNCTSLKTVNFGKSLKNISTNAFNNCTSLTKITLPDSMVTISGSAFANCAALKTVNCGNGLINICNGAFENCKKLEKINFSPVLNKIEYAAFENCSSLKEVILPDSLTSLTNYYSNGYGAFENCTALKIAIIGNGLTTISDDCFRNCASLEMVVFGENVRTISKYAFSNCTSIKELKFPDSLRTIGYAAFENCNSVGNIDFGAGVQSIARYAFSGCSSIKEISLPDSLTTLEDYYNNRAGAFKKCTALKTVRIGNGISFIPDGAFNDCTSLTTVVLGAGVTSLDESVFGNCPALKTVYFIGKQPTISSNNDNLMNATWYHLGQSSFTRGKVSKTFVKLTVNANGGTTLLNDEPVKKYTRYSDNGKISAPMVPTREGYSFKGWYLNSSCTGSKVDFNTASIKKDTTLYAKWEKNTYRIYFDAYGGKVSSGGKDVAYNNEIGTLPTPTLSGDVFEGWYSGMNCSGPEYTSDTNMPASDLVLYAGWRNNDTSTSVLFDTNGGSFIAPVSLNSGDTVSKPADPTKKGYQFLGWYTDVACTSRYSFSSPVNATMFLYAAWKPIPPSAPSSLSASSVTASSITVKWSAVSSAKAYYIYVNDSLYTFKPAGVTTCSITGLKSCKKYKVSVKSVNNSGESSTAKSVNCITKPATPTKFAAAQTTSSIKLTWNKVAGANGYRIYKYNTKTKKYESVVTTSATSYTIKKLSVGTIYKFKVRAYFKIDNSTIWGDYSKEVTTATKTAAISKIAAAQSTNSIKLAWNKVAGATGYRLYKYNTQKKKYESVATISTTTYTLKKLSAGTKYTFIVKAYLKAGGTTVWSDSSKAFETATKPATPAIKATSASKNTITITWGNVSGETGYQIFYSTSKYGTYKQLATTKANVTKVTVKNLVSGRSYYFRVRAYVKTASGAVYGGYKTAGVKVK